MVRVDVLLSASVSIIKVGSNICLPLRLLYLSIHKMLICFIPKLNISIMSVRDTVLTEIEKEISGFHSIPSVGVLLGIYPGFLLLGSPSSRVTFYIFRSLCLDTLRYDIFNYVFPRPF